MKNFLDYSKYYNLLYKDKDYLSEVEYIVKLLEKYSRIPVSEILDLGCGTGAHDVLFAEKSFKITGIDFSEKMIEIAKKQNNSNLEFLLGDVRNINLDKQFDAIISLFHVASYQTTNEDFNQYIQTAYKHLKKDGIFIFDFWYGPAVLTDLPIAKLKKVENDELSIIRYTEPILLPNENIIEVNFDVIVENKITKNIEKIKEIHRMRYWFLPELLHIIKINNFISINHLNWKTGNSLNIESWYGLIVARK